MDVSGNTKGSSRWVKLAYTKNSKPCLLNVVKLDRVLAEAFSRDCSIRQKTWWTSLGFSACSNAQEIRNQLVIQPTGPIFVAIRKRSFIRERPISVVAFEVVMKFFLKYVTL